MQGNERGKFAKVLGLTLDKNDDNKDDFSMKFAHINWLVMRSPSHTKGGVQAHEVDEFARALGIRRDHLKGTYSFELTQINGLNGDLRLVKIG